MQEKIQVGFQAFVSDGQEEFGAVRAISPDGARLTVYVENAGDFVVPADAVVSVQSEKVTFDCKKLEPGLRRAIGHAHESEQF
ncbi:MAG TPA: hypothetical protein VKZ18_16060 [Polyangia bacterium]|nr:hypothetical protein [Polyangia bacterium]